MFKRFVFISKYLIFYFIFISTIFITKIPLYNNITYEYMPELSIIIIFIGALFKNNKFISYFHIFLLGIFFDTLNLLPIGLTSFCWLISYKIISSLMNYFLDNKSIASNLRNFVIFMIISYLLKIFIMYFIFNTNYSFSYFFISIIVNSFYALIFFGALSKLDFDYYFDS